MGKMCLKVWWGGAARKGSGLRNGLWLVFSQISELLA